MMKLIDRQDPGGIASNVKLSFTQLRFARANHAILLADIVGSVPHE